MDKWMGPSLSDGEKDIDSFSLFLALLFCFQDLSSSARDWTWGQDSESTES